MKWAYLLSLSTTTIIESRPLEQGNASTKSSVISSQTWAARGIGCNRPVGLVAKCLFLWQTVHLHILDNVFVHTNANFTSPKCLLFESWNSPIIARISLEERRITSRPLKHSVPCSTINLVCRVLTEMMLSLIFLRNSLVSSSARKSFQCCHLNTFHLVRNTRKSIYYMVACPTSILYMESVP